MKTFSRAVVAIVGVACSTACANASDRDPSAEVQSSATLDDGMQSATPATGECMGAPLTEDAARTKLAASPPGAPVRLGRFSLAAAHRQDHFVWDPQCNQGRGCIRHTYSEYLPLEPRPFVAKDGWNNYNVVAEFPTTGDIVLQADAAGTPYLRLQSDAAQVVGPDTTWLMRLVSHPMRPWEDSTHSIGPDFALEESHVPGTPSWTPIPDYQRYYAGLSNGDNYSFRAPPALAFVTEHCAQFQSAVVPYSSDVRGAISIVSTFD